MGARRALVTGVSSYWGGRLAQRLEAEVEDFLHRSPNVSRRPGGSDPGDDAQRKPL